MKANGRKPWLAATLSLLCPGLGQFYCGRIVRGLVLFLLSLLFAPVTAVVAFVLPANGALYALMGACLASSLLAIVAVVDAWWIARPLRTEFTPREYQRPVLYGLFLIAGVVVPGCAAVAVTTRSFTAYKIASDSMSPTLLRGDRILANKLWFDYFPVQRGDVVVFRAPDGDRTYVKRVIGLPGDRVEVKGDHVILNGRPLPLDPPAAGVDDSVRVEHSGDRTYEVRVRQAPTDGPDTPESLVPDGSFFLLGDSRGASKDSRVFGPVPRRDLIGRADYLFIPVGGWDRAGALSDGK